MRRGDPLNLLSPETLLEMINEAYVHVDDKMIIRYMNGNAERLFRKPRTEAVGKPFDQAMPDATRAHQWPDLVSAIQGRKRVDLSVFYPTQYVWHDVKVSPVEGGGTALLMRDVTDRQWLIRREAERVYLRNVFEAVPVAITIMRGPKLVIEYMNAFGRQIVGDREIEGKTVREAFPDIEQQELFTILEGVYQNGESFQARDLLVRFDRNGDGKLEDGWFDISYLPARDFDGKVSGVISVSIEVTDRQRTR